MEITEQKGLKSICLRLEQVLQILESFKLHFEAQFISWRLQIQILSP